MPLLCPAAVIQASICSHVKHCALCLQVDSAYTVLLREKKLPMALLEDPESKRAGKAARASLVQTQPFAQTFGAKQTRKRPRLSAETYSDLLGDAAHHSAK